MRANIPRSMVSNLQGEFAAARTDSLQSVTELKRVIKIAASHDLPFVSERVGVVSWRRRVIDSTSTLL